MTLPNDSSPSESPQSSSSHGSRAWRTWLPPVLVVVGIGMVWGISQLGQSPPPARIAQDPLLVQGRKVYLNRCISCHGDTGAGNGPIAGSLKPPLPGNFLNNSWKHGKEPAQVLGVIRKGVRDTSMPAFQGLEDDASLQAVAAYVLHLASEPIPEAWRRTTAK